MMQGRTSVRPLFFCHSSGEKNLAPTPTTTLDGCRRIAHKTSPRHLWGKIERGLMLRVLGHVDDEVTRMGHVAHRQVACIHIKEGHIAYESGTLW
jgi:hypothetical protein